MPELYKIADKKKLSDDDLEYGVELLIEAEKIFNNKELYNNIAAKASEKALLYSGFKEEKKIKTLDDLKEVREEVNMNPARQRGKA